MTWCKPLPVSSWAAISTLVRVVIYPADGEHYSVAGAQWFDTSIPLTQRRILLLSASVAGQYLVVLSGRGLHTPWTFDIHNCTWIKRPQDSIVLLGCHHAHEVVDFRHHY